MKYNVNEKNILWLDSVPKLTQREKSKIYETLGDTSKLSSMGLVKSSIEEIIGSERINGFIQLYNNDTINTKLLYLDKVGVKFITIESSEYPEKLKVIPNPPLILYYMGDITLLHSKSIAIIGSRLCSSYGENVTQLYSRVLSQYGVTIVSGMAEGVDAIAHKNSLEAGGKTLAVLGSGFNHIYPISNKNLANSIVKNGLIITEFEPNMAPTKYSFPMRNRIIAGISDAVLVTEAGEKSGTQYTINYAMENNRNIYAVPGNITSKRSALCNKLIKECQCCITLNPEDILLDMNLIQLPINQYKTIQVDMEEKIVLDAFEGENSEVHFDILLDKSKLDIKKLITLLTNLEISGIIKKLPGNRYIILN